MQNDDGMIRDSKRKILLDIPLVHRLDSVISEKVNLLRKYWVPYRSAINPPAEVLARIDGLEIKKAQIISELNDFLTSTKREV